MAMSIHSLPVVQSGQAFWSEDSSSPDRGWFTLLDIDLAENLQMVKLFGDTFCLQYFGLTWSERNAQIYLFIQKKAEKEWLWERMFVARLWASISKEFEQRYQLSSIIWTGRLLYYEWSVHSASDYCALEGFTSGPGVRVFVLFCYLTLYSVCMGFFIFVRKSCSRAVTFLILSNKVMFMIKKNMITHNPYYI